MQSYYGPIGLRVWGERACFTRPEFKVDRVSYPIMTPTAARGVLEAIYWHPQMYWKVVEIHSLKPVRWFSWMVNEVTGDKGISKEWSAMSPFSSPNNRDQRHMLGLRDVEYMILAEVVSRNSDQQLARDDEAKHRDIFQRRVRSGACAYQPFLGVREFTGYFRTPDGTEQPVPLPESDLGAMVLTLFNLEDGPATGTSVQADRRMFLASAPGGILRV